MDKEDYILQARNSVMENPKVLCTGNPAKPGCIASGIKQVFPDATFIHKSNGYDLADINESMEQRLGELFEKHNTFINASYVADDCQQKLLLICNKHMKIGNIFNIGSTHEYDSLGDEGYTKSKQTLRELSLKLNSFRFQTCHIVLGGIRTGNEETTNWITPLEIADLIKWTTQQRYKIPIIGIDQPKRPW